MKHTALLVTGLLLLFGGAHILGVSSNDHLGVAMTATGSVMVFVGLVLLLCKL